VTGATIIVGCTNGAIRVSTNSGFSYTAGTGVGTVAVTDLRMSPDYANDNTILSGAALSVRISTDAGATWSRLGAAGPGTTGALPQIAFHPQYSTNSMVFAGSNTAGEGMFRWIVGTSTAWLGLGLNSDEASERVTGIAFSDDATMYVSDEAAFDATAGTLDGGVWSSVTSTAGSATSATGVSFGQMGITTNASNLAASDIAAVMTISDTRITIAETTGDDRLRHYTDTIGNTLLPTGLVPTDGSSGVGVSNAAANGVIGFSIGWDAVSGATSYQYDWGISSTFAGAETTTSAASSSRTIAEGSIVVADAGTGDTVGQRLAGTAYYFRVRVAAPVVGAYSAGTSFTTLLLAGATTGVPTLTQPNATNASVALSSSVDLRPLFVWSAVGGATNYELQVSPDGTFVDVSQIVINKVGDDALGNTLAHQAAADLQPGTVYFWRVRGTSGTTVGAYPPAAAFTTSSASVGSAVAAGTALATLEAAGNLELVSSFNYTSALYEAYVPDLAGNVLTEITPNSVIFITVTTDTTVVVSGVAFSVLANTSTPIPVGSSVTITIQ